MKSLLLLEMKKMSKKICNSNNYTRWELSLNKMKRKHDLPFSILKTNYSTYFWWGEITLVRAPLIENNYWISRYLKGNGTREMLTDGRVIHYKN